MHTSQLLGSKYRTFFHKLFVRIAIKFKWLRNVAYSEKELNNRFSTNFPQILPLTLKNINGELTILDAKLSIPLSQNKLHIELFCAVNLSFGGHDIYRAHLMVCGTVCPYYVAAKSTIRIKEMTLTKVNLVNDSYAFIGSSAELVTLFMPASCKYLLLGTMQLTLSILKGLIPQELWHYLQLYSAGSKQQILDFHRDDIENLLIKKVEQENCSYLLDKNDVEEQIFAEFGQGVAIEKGQLVFKFQHD